MCCYKSKKANGKVINGDVLTWQEKVQEIKTSRDKLSRQRPSCNCFNVVMFPNPVTRFRLGRKAAHLAKHVADLTASGEKLLANEIADLPADPNMPICDTAYQKFDSRDDAYGKLWKALVKEDGNQIIGIYGMPGVGKTRMMEQAWEDAKNNKIFNKVTRANVGAENVKTLKNQLAVITLQNQLAASLGCHFESADDVSSRATQLKNSISNAGKTLVVLDDVWDEISLTRIGIPLTDQGIPKGCKILLTSRTRDVCVKNKCTDPVKINQLTDGEAWDMFKRTVATPENVSLLNTLLAEEVCKKCAGLPLLIGAVGNALKFDNESAWRNALLKLRNHHQCKMAYQLYPLPLKNCIFHADLEFVMPKATYQCLFPRS